MPYRNAVHITLGPRSAAAHQRTCKSISNPWGNLAYPIRRTLCTSRTQSIVWRYCAELPVSQCLVILSSTLCRPKQWACTFDLSLFIPSSFSSILLLSVLNRGSEPYHSPERTLELGVRCERPAITWVHLTLCRPKQSACTYDLAVCPPCLNLHAVSLGLTEHTFSLRICLVFRPMNHCMTSIRPQDLPSLLRRESSYVSWPHL